jgi:hypothetical protein
MGFYASWCKFGIEHTNENTKLVGQDSRWHIMEAKLGGMCNCENILPIGEVARIAN